MKIRIRKCSNKIYWYKSLIGEEFFVVEKENIGYRVKENNSYNKYIDINDAEEFSTKEKITIMIKPEDVNTEYPFIGSEFKNFELEHQARILVHNLANRKKSFEDYFTLKDICAKEVKQLANLIDKDFVTVSENGNEFKVTEKFLRVVSKFKK